MTTQLASPDPARLDLVGELRLDFEAWRSAEFPRILEAELVDLRVALISRRNALLAEITAESV